MIGGRLQPHHFCKPIAKRPKDRKALIDVVLSQDPHFFLGTDSAPHTKERKECASGCAGVFTAPVALPLLAEFFSGNNALSRMEGFCSQFGADFYGLSRNTETLTLVKRPWVVPPSYVGVVPFYAGKEISWAVK